MSASTGMYGEAASFHIPVIPGVSGVVVLPPSRGRSNEQRFCSARSGGGLRRRMATFGTTQPVLQPFQLRLTPKGDRR